MWRKYQKIHMVGIGGSGMSGIAEVLHNLGFMVTGSDIQRKDITERLEKLGIKIFYGHAPENVEGAEVVVVSTAIPPDNPEVLYAHEKKIPVIPRAEMLAELMRMKYSIAVSGAHGKTTTTSMIASILEKAGYDPTVVVGGRIRGMGTGGKLGQSEYLVAEADESDGSFLKLFPTISVITNIDEEHIDTYGDMENLKNAFIEFANKVPFYGCTVISIDDPGARELLPRIKRRVLTFGLSRQADFEARELELKGLGSSYSLYVRGEPMGKVRLGVPGIFNVRNSLAAFATAFELDISPGVAIEALESFKGVMRRFEIKGEKKGIMVVDDYAHHPVEIEAVLKAARRFWEGRIIVLFQPHRYSRTRRLYRRFGSAFHLADILIITSIYPAGEKPLPGVTSELIYNAARDAGHREVYLIEDLDEARKFLLETLKEGDLFITMGAGNVWKTGEKLLEEL
ncbi:MAG: UDP-N-acetylmuramate--L-alanine ligase [Candidatus Hydrothermota bacterium]|nr:MAG: UDP-N-acetylmuramate--L-alanine ligase [Candidatus Hydrothermae bacterium]